MVREATPELAHVNAVEALPDPSPHLSPLPSSSPSGLFFLILGPFRQSHGNSFYTVLLFTPLKVVLFPRFCAHLKIVPSPGWMAQLVGASSHKLQGHGFDPQLGCVRESKSWSSLSLSFSLKQ